MVSAATIATVSITLFICLVLPVIVYLVYGIKNKGKGVWTAWLLGAAGFFVFQILLRSPILSVLSMTSWFTAFATKHYVWYCLLLALTAALFEAASAVGTVGLSLGVTPELGTVSRLILIFLMYIGRVGGLTMIYAVTSGAVSYAQYPQEQVNVG